jgi:hypothetical protein
MQLDDHVRRLARALWDFARLEEPLASASAIVGLGSYDLRVADRVAELWHEGLAPAVIFSGGWGAWTRDRWVRPEAEVFAARAMALGVPAAAIRLEPRSGNTGENVRFTLPMLGGGSAIWVAKPQMGRRVRATLDVHAPGPAHRVAVPRYGFGDAVYPGFTEAALVAELVGVHARLRAYPARGFQAPQPPDPVADAAFGALVALGYDSALA